MCNDASPVMFLGSSGVLELLISETFSQVTHPNVITSQLTSTMSLSLGGVEKTISG